tara:strand:- start:365 stop:559 length:195 start_codon:yes stop_codon:yes gene_type:complete
MRTYEKKTIILSLEEAERAILNAYSPGGGIVQFRLEDVSEGEEDYSRFKMTSVEITIVKPVKVS